MRRVLGANYLTSLVLIAIGICFALVSMPIEKADSKGILGMNKAGKRKIWKSKPAGSLSRTKCKTWQSTTENTADSENFTVQLLYIYPADKPNRFRRFANMMQRDAQLIDWLYVSRSRGLNRVAWDRGGSCGERYLDIRTVKLPHGWRWYKEKGYTVDITDSIRGHLVETLQADGSLENSQKHYLAYVDQIFTRGVTGPNALAYNYDDLRPGLDSLQISYDGFAFLLGKPNSEQFTGDNGLYSLLLRRMKAAHELTHLFGAVHPQAPNYSGGGHCSDGWDLMCNRSGRGLFPKCRGWVYLIDCGMNDYFNPFQVEPGSWLSENWNIADSPYLNGKLRQPAIEAFEQSRR